MYQRELAQTVAVTTGAGEIQPFYISAKRLMDLTVTVLALIVLAPVFLAIALCVKLSSDGPVLYKQTRIGRGGRPFTFYKFRTMYQNADPDVHRRYVQSLIRQQASDNLAPSGAGTPMYKLQKDPRITPLGGFLRRTSLDELPQLLNVVRGDMSLVGPRPPLPYEVEAYQEWHMARLSALPGITGLWQVHGRSRVTFDDMVRMDIDYITHRSLWLDMKLLVLTIPAVLAGTGAL